MKKLLNISVIAALAILPMAANAATGDIVVGNPTAASSADPVQNDSTVTTSVEPKYALATEGDHDGNLATAGYVKGAYNATIKAINKVAETAGNALTASGTATLTNKTIDADDNTIQDLTTSNLKSGTLVDSSTGIADASTASDTKLVSEKAVASAIDGMVTETGTQTLTNKTIDGDDNTIQDLGTGVFKTGTLVDSTTGIAATTSASDSKLVTEKAVAAALDDYATQTAVENTIETASITATVPTLTTWGNDSSTSTVGVTVTSIAATYAEP